MNPPRTLLPIPGFAAGLSYGYYIDEKTGQLWSYFPNRKSGEPWYMVKGRDGRVKLVTGIDAEGRYTTAMFEVAELIAAVNQKRKPIPAPEPLTTEERLAVVESRLDAIMRHLGIAS
jgi:hypothetical protein